MRVSRAEAAQNRERVIEVAAKLFRERGFDGIGVADLMKAAGLTHGGFYGHFESKEDLMAQACSRAVEGSLAALHEVAERDGANALAAIASAYLSPAHRDQTGEGCVMAALGAEAARHGSPVRNAFTQGVRSTIDVLTRLVPGASKRAKRKQAVTTYASMIGALVLARAIDDAELSEEILQSVLASITQINSSASSR
ncbi:MAG TPA: TetR/AcrR family transcriptional regulator [Rhodocyclaceae bacterium]|nr:TetR/AcrR family transcriptional regulator [Rhodocyclaceae bacterium]